MGFHGKGDPQIRLELFCGPTVHLVIYVYVVYTLWLLIGVLAKPRSKCSLIAVISLGFEKPRLDQGPLSTIWEILRPPNRPGNDRSGVS